MRTREWDVALDPWIATERERLGGRPSSEEIAAYHRGELRDEEAERVRALLVYYPDLTPLLLSSEEKRATLTHYLPLGAGVLIALVSISRWFDRSEPYVYRTVHTLEPLNARGVAEPPVYELPSGQTQYLLTLVTSSDYKRYRVEIVRDTTVVWETTAEASDGTITLSIPRKDIDGETHRIDLYGIDDDGEHRVDSYRVRVKAPATE